MKRKSSLWLAMALFSLSCLNFAACSDDEPDMHGQEEGGADKGTPYITEVFGYVPAPGQFVNELPKYDQGDTELEMVKKAKEAICNNAKGMITLGGFGGYVVVGFDHEVKNMPGLCDFRILGNTFADSSEPGIVMVSADTNGDGKPNDEWYEIAGSAYHDAKSEAWYKEAQDCGNDLQTHHGFSITYHKPAAEPSADQWNTYIKWEDNKGNNGYVVKNQYHQQTYYPAWIKGNELKFEGLTRLPQNGVKVKGTSSDFDYLYYLKAFAYGYADNVPNADKAAAIDIDWAVDKNGKAVNLKHINFVKIYTGVNQDNGQLGECSTEITGVEDLHLLGEEVATINRK